MTNNVIPTGRKTIPTRKKTGRTVLAVKTGCHAVIRCCLKGESKRKCLIIIIFLSALLYSVKIIGK